MKPKELTILCRYSNEETNIPQIIQDCFDVFLRKALQNVEKSLMPVV